MTGETEFERTVHDWLTAGATRAPEAPIEAAIEHARRHPRRRDPFVALRADPMPTRVRRTVARPVLVFAALGLLIVAAVGLATIGSPRPAIVPPSPSPTATPSPSPAVTSSPTPAPTPLAVVIDTGTAAKIRVFVTDASGTLVGARSGPPRDGGSVEPGTVLVENENPQTLRLTWTWIPCTIDYRLAIDPTGRAMTLEQPRCDGDTIALDRVLLLEFAGPVDAAGITVSLVDVDAAG